MVTFVTGEKAFENKVIGIRAVPYFGHIQDWPFGYASRRSRSRASGGPPRQGAVRAAY